MKIIDTEIYSLTTNIAVGLLHIEILFNDNVNNNR